MFQTATYMKICELAMCQPTKLFMSGHCHGRFQLPIAMFFSQREASASYLVVGFPQDSVLLLKTWAFWPAVILCSSSKITHCENTFRRVPRIVNGSYHMPYIIYSYIYMFVCVCVSYYMGYIWIINHGS